MLNKNGKKVELYISLEDNCDGTVNLRMRSGDNSNTDEYVSLLVLALSQLALLDPIELTEFVADKMGEGKDKCETPQNDYASHNKKEVNSVEDLINLLKYFGELGEKLENAKDLPSKN